MKEQHDTQARLGAGIPYFGSFAEFEDYLDTLGLFRMTLGLERMRSMLTRLQLIRPPFYTVQVVGTNGKGSTSTMLAALSHQHGLKTGLCTSPHFLSVRERVRVNGAMLDEADWLAAANRIMEQGGRELSYFEFITSLAVLVFATQGVEFAVMETGLGGAYDATTAIEADLLVYTPIGLDHQAVLGPTVAHIAADKAQAIREKKPVVSARQPGEAENALRQRADACHAQLTFIEEGRAAASDMAGACALALEGEHQRDNARLALAAWQRARPFLAKNIWAKTEQLVQQQGVEQIVCDALQKAWLPGRMQYVPGMPLNDKNAEAFPCSLGWPPLLLDGAHNSHGLSALGMGLAVKGIAPGAVIFSCLGDKDLDDMVSLLRALATGPIFVPPVRDNPRAAVPAELAQRIGLNAVPTDSLAEALRAASSHMADRIPEVFTQREASRNPLLLCGSLYLLGEFYALRPDCLHPQ